MWNDFVKNTLLKPLLERLGTAGATALVVGGEYVCQKFGACGLVTESGATQVATWVVAAALVLVDLTPGWVRWVKDRR